MLASIFAYAAAKGLDIILGKWLAYATIAWEQVASQTSKEAFNAAMAEIKTSMPDKAQAWADWQKRVEGLNAAPSAPVENLP